MWPKQNKYDFHMKNYQDNVCIIDVHMQNTEMQMVVKFEVSNANSSAVIDINVVKENIYGYQILNTWDIELQMSQ